MTADDAPRILNTDIPEWVDGKPGQLISIERTTNFSFEIIVTPVDYTTVNWNIDGEDVFTGAEIDMPLLAGIHDVVVTATTKKNLSTKRDFYVTVRPVDGDPVLTDIPANRVAAPGTDVAVEGTNLANIKKVALGSTEIEVSSATATSLAFTVPASIANDVYDLVLIDAEGTKLGGVYTSSIPGGVQYATYTLSISSSPFVIEGELRAKPGAEVTLHGINMDNVASLKLGDTDVTIGSKAFDNLVFTCPALEAGDYELTGKDTAGAAISFNGNESAKVTVTSEVTLWEGSFNVTWGTPFDALKDTFPTLVSAGTVVRAYVNGSGQGSMCTAWWNNILTGKGDPERGDIAISGEMVLEYALTEFSMELMNTQNGVLFVGDGYTITRITAE